MDFKQAARTVLSEVGRPLHYTDITEMALKDGYLESAGRTPQNTMRARLSVDVRDNPDSPFVQTAPGVYGLADRNPEFVDTKPVEEIHTEKRIRSDDVYSPPERH